MDLNTGGQHVIGIGQRQPTFAAGEQCFKHPGEFGLDVLPGVGKELQNRGVDIFNHAAEVLAGLLNVHELGGKE